MAGYQQSGRRGKLIVLAGPSGVGKGAIVARLLAALPDLELSISATTRGPRPREDEGRHYHFVDRGKFDEMVEAGGFLEWADIFGERYGTPGADRPRPGRGPRRARRDRRPGRPAGQGGRAAGLHGVHHPAEPPGAGAAAAHRGSETDQQISGRLAKASDELAAEPEFDVTVVNDDLETAAREVVEIVDRLRRRTINGGHTRVKERKH